MSTLFREHTPFDILFRNLFNSDIGFIPAVESKQSHPLDIYYNDYGLWFEIACTGLTKEDINLDIDGDLLKIGYKKPKEENDGIHAGTIYKGLSKRSFNLGYKVANKFDLTKVDASMENGLLIINIPYSAESKPKTIKIK
tara:strand:- start:395 stop:814 length:420 start_codon:yes stop_codon:yes gene_type:complete